MTTAPCPAGTSGGVIEYQSGAAADVQIWAPVMALNARTRTPPPYAVKKTRLLAASTDAAPTWVGDPTNDHTTPPLGALMANSAGLPETS